MSMHPHMQIYNAAWGGVFAVFNISAHRLSIENVWIS